MSSFFDKVTDAITNPAALQKAQVPNFIAKGKAALPADPEAAIKLFNMAVKADPENAEAWAGLGEAYSDSNQSGLAAEAFQKLVELSPDSSSAFSALGTEQLSLEKYEDSERSLMHGLLLAEQQDAVDLYNLALTLYRQNKEAQAIPFCQRALDQGPDPDTEELLADCLYGLDDYEDAVNHYKKALEADSTNPHCESNLGYSLEMLGRHQEAIPYLTSAIKNGAIEPEVYGSLSRCCEAVGDEEGAKEMAAKYYELAPQTGVEPGQEDQVSS